MSSKIRILALFLILSVTPFIRGCGETFGFPFPAFAKVLQSGRQDSDRASLPATISAVKDSLSSKRTQALLAANILLALLLARSVSRHNRRPIWKAAFLDSLTVSLLAVWSAVWLMFVDTGNPLLKRAAELYGRCFGRCFIDAPSSIAAWLDKATAGLHGAPVLMWKSASKALGVVTEDIVARSWFIAVTLALGAVFYALRVVRGRSRIKHHNRAASAARRKLIRRVLLAAALITAAYYIVSWAYMNRGIALDTKEVDRYYDILSKHAGRSGEPVFKLGITEEDDLQAVVDKLKGRMGLKDYSIWVGYGDQDFPPAYVTNDGRGIITVTLSKKVREKREQINVLTHELSHIYVWSVDKAFLEGCDEEKFVDCAGIFLGLGIPILNGLTDRVSLLPGGEYREEKRMYGYIRPEQAGYLVARYFAERGISRSDALPYLTPSGRKYFDIGYGCLKRSGRY